MTSFTYRFLLSTAVTVTLTGWKAVVASIAVAVVDALARIAIATLSASRR